MRDHQPVIIEEFNGLWVRGPEDSTPRDHFIDCENIQFKHREFHTRDGLQTFKGVANPVRIYNYPQSEGDSLLILDNLGSIYHYSFFDDTLHGPILTLPDMLDFNFVSYNGRAYITPFQIEISAVLEVHSPRALQTSAGGWVYVYLGDGTPARKAAGDPPTAGSLTLANGAAGNVEAGIHIFGVAYETDTGFLTQATRLTQVTATGTQEIDISAIPVSPDSFVVARRIVATRAIDPALFTGDLEGYQLFLLPDGRIDNNIDTTLSVNFYDSELLLDASYLLDILSEIPSTIGLTTYHGRMIAYSTYDDVSIALVSKAGEPEVFDAVSGLIIVPGEMTGEPITNAQEFRDVLYLFKQFRTFAATDNGDVPTTWPVITTDQGTGCSAVHGVAQVLDSGGINIEYLLIIDFSGIYMFNGAYSRPELTWKIADYWLALERNDYENFQFMNDTINKRLYINLPDGYILYADYSNDLNAKDIKWAKWRFDVQVTTIALMDTDRFVIGSLGEVE